MWQNSFTENAPTKEKETGKHTTNVH